MSGKITSIGSGSVMGTRQIIRDGLIAYWDAANYLSIPTASTGYFGTYTDLVYDLIGQNHLTPVSSAPGTSTSVKYKTAYNNLTSFNPYNGHLAFPNAAATNYIYSNTLTGDLATPSLSGLTLEFVGVVGDDGNQSGFFAKGTSTSTSTADYFLDLVNTSISTPQTMSFGVNVGGTRYSVVADDLTYPQGWSTIYHMCGTYDGSTIKFYLNGVQSSKTTSVAGVVRNTGTYCIFYYADNLAASGYFLAFRIYNRALSSQEIQQNYLAQKGRYNNTPPSP